MQQLKEQAYKLSVSDRLALVSAVVESIQDESPVEDWHYLVARSHPWRKQLYVKASQLVASTVWQDMLANQMSPEQAAENWDLPRAAIDEMIDYCERHSDPLKLEADEEGARLAGKGVLVESQSAA